MNSRGEGRAPGILILECSTSRGSVALVDDSGMVHWHAEFSAGRGRGGELFRALEEAMRRVAGAGGDGPRALVEVVVGLGPGSYSGVRQAIAAANGLALATGARLSGVASPLALGTDAANYHAVGDARRGAFYYTAVEAGRCIRGPELVEDAESLRIRLAERPDWPVLAVENVPPGLPPETPVAWPSALRLPLASRADRREPPLEPIYLRPVSITLPKKP